MDVQVVKCKVCLRVNSMESGTELNREVSESSGPLADSKCYDVGRERQ